MAQWLGQYSGNTHSTRVEDLEAALRQGVAAFHTAKLHGVRQTKAKAVRHLAKRLLSARLRLFKARIADLEVGNRNLQSLRQREEQTRNEGVNGILAEFNASDASIPA